MNSLARILLIASLPLLAAAPAMAQVAPGSGAAPRCGSPLYVSVRAGASLTDIAREAGQRWRDILRWNALKDANEISVGQQLRVQPPECGSARPPAAPAQNLGSSLSGELVDKPNCDLDFLMTETLKDDLIVPTGLRASNENWLMEIYSNNATGEWVLMAAANAPQPHDRMPELCILARSRRAPYAQTSWYREIFAPAARPDKTQR